MTALAGLQPGAVPAPAPAGANRLFAAGSNATMEAHLDAFGPFDPETIDARFIGTLEGSGLTGRGGAAFPTWRKLAATTTGRRPRPAVIANGAEGEPLGVKDKTLLLHAPHLVIDGLVVAGRAVNATRLHLYAGAASMDILAAALAGRPDARSIKLTAAPETFIAGEASAAVNRIGGGSALPMDKAARFSESGLKSRPTLVLNVETLAHVALIARYGAAWFRSIGSGRDPGTRLVSVGGHGADLVLEIEGDASLETVLASAGVERSTLRAVLVGGFHGRWVHPTGRRISPRGTPGESVRPGAGVIHVLPAARCGLQATAGIVNYLAAESARQCGPCMFGLPAMAGVLRAIADGARDPALPGEVRRLAALVTGRRACHHPDGTAQLVSSALEVFADDVAAHLSGRCTARGGGFP